MAQAPGGGTSTATGYASTQKPAAISDAYAMFTKARPLPTSPASGEGSMPRWSVWAAGYGGSQTTDGNAALGSNTATSRIAGVAVGADYRFSPNTIAGFALAGGGTSFSVNELRQRPLRPVPGRRLRAPQCRPGVPHRRPSLTAGRTSPPIAP